MGGAQRRSHKPKRTETDAAKRIISLASGTIIMKVTFSGQSRTFRVSRKGQKGQHIFWKREISISKHGYENKNFLTQNRAQKGYLDPVCILTTHCVIPFCALYFNLWREMWEGLICFLLCRNGYGLRIENQLSEDSFLLYDWHCFLFSCHRNAVSCGNIFI